ncbi:MAG: hypothetical protein H6510_07665 [Acidobacteria bacterium]|nr:hypothetical protein [Acidobacteriota bacterium]
MDDFTRFRHNLMQINPFLTDPNQQDYLFQVAKKCALIGGLPLGGAAAKMTMASGTILVPGVGALPGWFVGAMAGFLTGTAMCMVAQSTIREQLNLLLD